jgi:hypothetical protein
MGTSWFWSTRASGGIRSIPFSSAPSLRTQARRRRPYVENFSDAVDFCRRLFVDIDFVVAFFEAVVGVHPEIVRLKSGSLKGVIK